MGAPGHLYQPGAPGVVGALAIGDAITGGTAGSVLFVGASQDLQQDNAAFFWNDTLKTLILGGDASIGRSAAGRLQLTATGGATSPKLDLSAAAGNNREIYFTTAGVLRWIIRGADSGSESGANAGSDFSILCRSDAGAAIISPIAITRATGAITLTTAATGAITFNTAGVNRWQVSAAGDLVTATDGVPDIGAAANFRPRTIYVKTSIVNAGQYLGNSAGVISFASAALATGATTGWLTIPSCAGAPTGVPANLPTGQVGLVYDSTNNKLYVYNGGWKKAQVTAVDAIYA